MGREDDIRNSATRNTAQLRFAIIGPPLASPPPRGGLQAAIQDLSEQDRTTPGGRTRRFSTATIERWYYATQKANADPMAALRRRRRSDMPGIVLRRTHPRNASTLTTRNSAPTQNWQPKKHTEAGVSRHRHPEQQKLNRRSASSPHSDHPSRYGLRGYEAL